MSGLPHGLAEPLRYQDAFPWGWLVFWTVLALVALWVIVRVVRLRRVAEADEPAAAPPPPVEAPVTGLEAEIRDLLRRYRLDARAGCHHLAALLRGEIGRRRGRDLSRHTARELETELGDTRVSRLFHLLAELQFGRRPPTAGDLGGVCELTLEAVAPATARGTVAR